MAWGSTKRDISELLDGRSSLVILRHRQFGPAEALRVAAAIRSTSLTELRCSGHEIGVDGVRALGEAIAASTSMRVVDAGADLGDAGAAALAVCLRCATLECLELENKTIGDGGVAALASELATSSLRTLQLSRNSFRESQPLVDAVAASKLEALDVSGNECASHAFLNTGIEELQCRRTRFDVAVAARLTWTVRKLDVSDCGLTSLDPLPLEVLRELRAARNSISSTDAFADLRLDVLDLSSNAITDVPLVATHLYVHDNALGDAPIVRLAAALGDSVVRTLGLAHNGLGDIGAQALVTALEDPSCPVALVELGNNPGIGPDSKAAFRRAKDRHPGLDVAQLS